MPELASWLKNADANSFGEGLTATEAKALKDYLHGKFTPTAAAPKFIENMEPVWNPSFQGHLTAITWDVSDSHGQIKIVNPLVPIRNLRCGMKKGRHDLTYVLAEFGHSIA